MKTLEISKSALESATPDQLESIWHLLLKFPKVSVGLAGFDLPTGYLAFVETYENGMNIFGGIAPNGDVST
jgi:hypothetical protein